MELFFAVLICKVLRIVLKTIGKGSSFPGQVVLKIFPNCLSKIKLPKYVIAVTGSNGKTSTVEMIHNVLVSNGCSVAYNYEGSNQIEGVATLLLSNCTLFGKCKCDVCLLEVDERYAEKIFKQITPTHLVVTNIFRDQQTRNGNREWVYNCIKKSINKKTNLILNADDPLTSLLSECCENTVFYGIDQYNKDANIGVFDDGIYCPRCGNKLSYKYRHFDILGSFECKSCGHKKSEVKYAINKIDLKNSKIYINDNEISLAFSSLYNVNNILSAYSLSSEIGIEKNVIISSLNNYMLKNNRIVEFDLNNKHGIFLASKHENPVSYNQSMTYISNYQSDVSILIVVDKISRKYYTSETSWLWDIDFNILNSNNVKQIILSGTYAYDLALRFEYSKVNKNIISVHDDIDDAIEQLSNFEKKNLFIITCFADQDNVLGKVKQHG